ncbi:2-succinyl-5-enolpyruvyl-6-hydroxy-3-cyclohexene-1-carboxylic-acid synthase [Rothia sp. 110740021-2]
MTENRSTPAMLTAVSVLDSLIRAGMRHVVVSPGSRSAPLAYAIAAAAEAGALIAHVRVDERSAAFTALGIAKASGQPVGLVCTSGTALGEYVPAVMEAYHAGVPLAVLSADRPEHLRGSGVNQTTRQASFFHPFVRAEADLTSYPEQVEGEQTQAFAACLNALTGRSAEHWRKHSTEPIGPVHLNICFDTPLTPSGRFAQMLPQWALSLLDDYDPQAEGRARAARAESPGLSSAEQRWLLDSLESQADLAELTPTHRTVVVAADGAGEFAAEFARVLNLPLFAEPSSEARHGVTSIPHYPQLLADGSFAPAAQIEHVVLFGHPTLSRPITALLEREDIQCAFYAPRRASWYEPGVRSFVELSTPHELAEFACASSVAANEQVDELSWLEQWVTPARKLQEKCLRAIAAYEHPDAKSSVDYTNYRNRTAGRSYARRVWQDAVTQRRLMVLGSSNLVRDLDAAAPALGEPAPTRVFANRGLAGIDGTIATAIGVSLSGYYPAGMDENSRPVIGGAALPVTLLCGDLTFQHDVSSLNLPNTELLPELRVEVFDDAGGGIFTTLEHGDIARQKQFTAAVDRFFTVAAAPNTDLARMAAGFGTESGIEVCIHTP